MEQLVRRHLAEAARAFEAAVTGRPLAAAPDRSGLAVGTTR